MGGSGHGWVVRKMYYSRNKIPYMGRVYRHRD
jgi:hypothetical protein